MYLKLKYNHCYKVNSQFGMNIIIDTHEEKLISLMNINTNDESYIKIQPLEIGDIHFEFLNENNQIIKKLIIERKTHSDLFSSIQSGRYGEQKIRLLSAVNPDESRPILAYLIEGTGSLYINKDIIESAILGTSIRDGFIIIYSDSVEHTMKIINKIYNKSDDYFNNTTNINSKYLKSLNTNIKTCKKENLTPDKCFILQLAQIPNVSVNIAEQIAKLYPNFGSLINDINLDKVLFYNKIKEIKIGSRKIGPVLAQRFIDYLI